MKCLRLTTCLLIILSFVCNFLFAQQNTFELQLATLKGVSFKKVPNDYFNDYYELLIDQPLDHFASTSKVFKQRIFIGLRSTDSTTVMDTDGYGIPYASQSNFKHELATLVNANLVVIEHRFFGQSVPDTLAYSCLTVEQAAADDHAIKLLLAKLFKGKWISTGISKGGQAALAYKLYYPNDVSATVVYGTAVKKALTETKIDSMLNYLSQSDCGKKLNAFQLQCFKQKAILAKLFNDYVIRNQLELALSSEQCLDYMLLELPFSFWQQGIACATLPNENENVEANLNFVMKVVPPSFYSTATMNKLKAAFYMNYHQLGYYEYNLEKFKPFLSADNYSNKKFCPALPGISFDDKYLKMLSSFLNTENAKSIVFIYGENDPWSAMQSVGKAQKIIIKEGSHKSRIANMDTKQQTSLLQQLSLPLGNK